MFRRFAAFVTTTAVLWHALAGCCTQCGQAAAASRHVESAPNASHASSCCLHACCQRTFAPNFWLDLRDAPAEPAAPPAETPHECPGHACTFAAISAPGPAVDLQLLGADFPGYGLIADLISEQSAPLAASEGARGREKSPCRALRPHLALSVLTI